MFMCHSTSLNHVKLLLAFFFEGIGKFGPGAPKCPDQMFEPQVGVRNFPWGEGQTQNGWIFNVFLKISNFSRSKSLISCLTIFYFLGDENPIVKHNPIYILYIWA